MATALELALEGDDPWADHICPGCKQDITGWGWYRYHYKIRVVLSASALRRRAEAQTMFPFTNSTHAHREHICEWGRDELLARVHARRLISEAREKAHADRNG